MTNINNATRKFIGDNPISWTAVGSCINTASSSVSTSPQPYAHGRYAIISCQPGDKFTINAQGVENYSAWTFINNNNIKLTTTENLQVNGQVIIAPENAKYLIINNIGDNDAVSYYGDSDIAKIKQSNKIANFKAEESGVKLFSLNNSENIIQEINKLKETYNITFPVEDYNIMPLFTQKQYITGQKTIIPNQNYRCTDRIPVKKGDVLRYNLRGSAPIIIYPDDNSEPQLIIRQSGLWAYGEHTFSADGQFQACTVITDFELARAYLTTSTIPIKLQHNKNYAYLITSWDNGYYDYDETNNIIQFKQNNMNVTTNYIPTEKLPHTFYVSPHVKGWIEYLDDQGNLNTEAENSDGGYHLFGSINLNNIGAKLTPDQNTMYIKIMLYKNEVNYIQIEEGQNYTQYDAPAFTLSEHITLNNTQRKVIENYLAATDILYGKKWTVCGDSFSFGAFQRSPTNDWTIEQPGPYQYCQKTYCNLIANRHNMQLQNLSRNGQTMATPTDNTYHKAFSDLVWLKQGYHNYTEIDQDTDYITLYFGINDFYHQPNNNVEQIDDEEEDSAITSTVSLGQPTDGFTEIINKLFADDSTINDPQQIVESTANTTITNATFCGAYNIVLGWIKKNRPFAHVGIIVTNGASNEFAQATISIAKQWGIPYINMNGDEKTPFMISSTNPEIPEKLRNFITKQQAVLPEDDNEFGKRNVHPNAKAHEFQSYFIETFLKTI